MTKLTDNDRIKLAAQVLPIVVEREKINNADCIKDLKLLLDDNTYLASEALRLVDALEKEAGLPYEQNYADHLQRLDHSSTA